MFNFVCRTKCDFENAYPEPSPLHCQLIENWVAAVNSRKEMKLIDAKDIIENLLMNKVIVELHKLKEINKSYHYGPGSYVLDWDASGAAASRSSNFSNQGKVLGIDLSFIEDLRC